MAHGLDSSKSAARPSHEAIEGRGSEETNDQGKGGERKLDNAAMRGAKRAQNRLVDNEEKTPGRSIFSK